MGQETIGVPTSVPVPTISTADRFAVTIPGDWMVLPLDPRNRDRRIARMVEKEFGKDDKDVVLRRQKIVRLRKAAADAADNGGFFAALSGRLVGEVAMASSLVVCLLPPLRGPDSQPLPDVDAMAGVLAADTEKGKVIEHSVAELPYLGRAARVRRRAGTGFTGEDGTEAEGETVQYYLPLEEVNKTLALLFATPFLPLADAYAQLFDLVAATARWVQTSPEEESP